MSNIRTTRTWLAEQSSEDREHILGDAPRLWLKGGQFNKPCRLLTDFDFIEAKINHPKFGVQVLIEDYDLIDDTELLNHLEYSVQTVKTLKLIQGALRLSAHILIQDPKQLAGQLLGRLLSFNQPEIQTCLQQAKQWEGTPWLRPLEQFPAPGRHKGVTMNTPPSQTSINSASYPTEFQQVILEKSQNFIGREFIFTAISDFLHCHKCGYFTIVGVPGSGKSAILAKYVTENPDVVYYNAQVEGKNRAEEFLTDVCQQIIETRRQMLQVEKPAHSAGENFTSLQDLPDNAREGSWFLSFLLQKISDRLEQHQRLIIAIDALDAIHRSSQPLGTNLFYLSRYLPDGVYFILTRRPFLREQSGLLIETPSRILDLSEYPQENQEDVQAYIRRNLTLLFHNRKCRDFAGKVSTSHNINEEEFIARLITKSENNFMYLHHILNAMFQGSRYVNAVNLFSEPFQVDRIPSGLEAYYQQHWQNIKGGGLSNIAVKVLRVLTSAENGGKMSAKAIAQILDEDEYDVEELVENWFDFLQQQRVGRETCYSLYHSDFRVWLAEQISILS